MANRKLYLRERRFLLRGRLVSRRKQQAALMERNGRVSRTSGFHLQISREKASFYRLVSKNK